MADYEPEEQFANAASGMVDFGPIRTIVGLALILGGGVMAFWICTEIHDIFTNPQEIGIFREIIPPGSEPREMDIDGQKIVLPEGIFIFMAYGIGILLLMVGASIAKTFMNGGVTLLRPSFRKLEMNMNRRFDRLRSTLEDMKGRIEKRVP